MPVLPTYPVSNPFAVNKTAHGRHLHTVEVAGSNPAAPTNQAIIIVEIPGVLRVGGAAIDKDVGNRQPYSIKLLIMKWLPFRYDGKAYDLAHLHPCTLEYQRPSEGNKAAEVYRVEVTYTLHCFSRDLKPKEVCDDDLMYSDGYESRVFDFRRYELSKLLPGIIQALPDKKPYHNKNRRNFFTVEVTTENESAIEYDIFFKVKKKAKGRLEMIIETAFVRDPGYDSTRPDGKPIRFWIILHNTMNNKAIRT